MATVKDKEDDRRFQLVIECLKLFFHNQEKNYNNRIIDYDEMVDDSITLADKIIQELKMRKELGE